MCQLHCACRILQRVQPFRTHKTCGCHHDVSQSQSLTDCLVSVCRDSTRFSKSMTRWCRQLPVSSTTWHSCTPSLGLRSDTRPDQNANSHPCPEQPCMHAAAYMPCLERSSVKGCATSDRAQGARQRCSTCASDLGESWLHWQCGKSSGNSSSR